MDPLALRDEVCRVVLTHDFSKGPLLLLAGPGTGKTHNLGETIKEQMAQGLSHNDCFEATLTNAAADDFIVEARKKVHPEYDNCSTLHSRAKGILHRHARELGLPAGFTILEDGCGEVVEDDLNHLLGTQDAAIRLREYRRATATCKSRDASFEGVYGSLQAFYAALDWYDTVSLACRLLREHPEACDAETGEFAFLLIDEYQDLNPCDQDLVQLLVHDRSQLLAVGDDDQSIYSLRYADPSGITGFQTRYPSATVIDLPVCSRLPSAVSEAAYSLISKNSSRKPKPKLVPLPRTDARAKGGFAASVNMRSGKAEREFLGDTIWQMVQAGIPPSKILVLCNCRALGQELLADMGTSHPDVPVADMLTTDESSDADKYLLRCVRQFLARPEDNLSLRVVLSALKGADFRASGLVARALADQNTLWSTLSDLCADQDQTVIPAPVREFQTTVAEALVLSDADQRVRSVVSMTPSLRHLADVDLEAEVTPDGPSGGQTDSGQVRFMTLHRSKGLDSDYVFVPFMEESVGLPAADKEEARRLLYVAVTRARVGVLFTWAWSRRSNARYKCKGRGGGATGRAPSTLIEECGLNHSLGRQTDTPSPAERALSIVLDHTRHTLDHDAGED